MKKNLKIFLSLLTGAFLPLCVWADDVYMITGVPISGEADSAAHARETALARGKEQAFQELLDTIIAVKDREKVQINDTQLIESFVQDISVSNEKAGSTKYYGALTVRFKAPEIRKILEDAQVSFLTRLPQPFLVIPVYQNEQNTFIFSADNPLQKAIQNGMPATRLFTFQTALGDETDAKAAFNGIFNQSRQAFTDLIQRYYVSQILIFKIIKHGNSYQVSTTVWPNGTAPEAEVSFKVSDDRESPERICADLLHDAVRSMTKKWLYLSQNTAQPITVYQVIAPIEKVSDLSRMRQKLSRLNFADKVDIKGFSNKQLVVDFHYRGSVMELEEKLRLNNLTLIQTTDASGQPIYQLTEANPAANFNETTSSDLTD